jgi:hypothetical protein
VVLNAKHEFEAIAADISDRQVKKLADEMSNLADVLQNLYDQVEGLWIASFTGRKQIEILKDAILSVPEVPINSEVMKRI